VRVLVSAIWAKSRRRVERVERLERVVVPILQRHVGIGHDEHLSRTGIFGRRACMMETIWLHGVSCMLPLSLHVMDGSHALTPPQASQPMRNSPPAPMLMVPPASMTTRALPPPVGCGGGGGEDAGFTVMASFCPALQCDPTWQAM